jgi:hypothetical protein
MWSFGGCSANPGPAPRPPAVGHAPQTPATRAFDARLVDPRFEWAVAEFSADLRRLRRTDSTDVEVRRTLRLLAIAVERVPYAGSVDVEGASAIVRGGRARRAGWLAFGGTARTGGDPHLVGQSLEALSETFVALARGPYRAATGVIGEAYAFDAAARQAGQSGGEQGRCSAALTALSRAEAVLLAMRAAVGRGEVGLLDQAPPPVAWER